MISKEEFKKIEREYNTWLNNHPKGDYSYKKFSHIRRTLEFAKYYNDKQVKKLTIPDFSISLGDRVTTEIVYGHWFTGIYSSDFPDSNSILIDDGNMTLIVPKKECELAD